MKSSSQRRFEILLPLRFNDGKPVPEELLVETQIELENQFEAVSVEMGPIRGFWRHDGKRYLDDLVRIYVDVDDTRKNRRFFQEMKKIPKERFKQIDIRITTYRIEII